MCVTSSISGFQTRAERSPATTDVGGDAAQHPRRRASGHQQLRLSRLRHEHCTAVRRQWQPRHQRHNQHVSTAVVRCARALRRQYDVIVTSVSTLLTVLSQLFHSLCYFCVAVELVMFGRTGSLYFCEPVSVWIKWGELAVLASSFCYCSVRILSAITTSQSCVCRSVSCRTPRTASVFSAIATPVLRFFSVLTFSRQHLTT